MAKEVLRDLEELISQSKLTPKLMAKPNSYLLKNIDEFCFCIFFTLSYTYQFLIRLIWSINSLVTVEKPQIPKKTAIQTNKRLFWTKASAVNYISQ